MSILKLTNFLGNKGVIISEVSDIIIDGNYQKHQFVSITATELKDLFDNLLDKTTSDEVEKFEVDELEVYNFLKTITKEDTLIVAYNLQGKLKEELISREYDF